jgi:hypothetical protein
LDIMLTQPGKHWREKFNLKSDFPCAPSISEKPNDDKIEEAGY